MTCVVLCVLGGVQVNARVAMRQERVATEPECSVGDNDSSDSLDRLPGT